MKFYGKGLRRERICESPRGLRCGINPLLFCVPIQAHRVHVHVLQTSRGFARWLAGVSSIEREAIASNTSNAIELYPLPLGDRATARVQLDHDGFVRLDAYTLDGRYLGLLLEGWLNAGIHDCAISLGGLANGPVAIVLRRDGRVRGTTFGLRSRLLYTHHAPAPVAMMPPELFREAAHIV